MNKREVKIRRAGNAIALLIDEEGGTAKWAYAAHTDAISQSGNGRKYASKGENDKQNGANGKKERSEWKTELSEWKTELSEWKKGAGRYPAQKKSPKHRR